MPSTYLHIFLSDGTARAICWTLLHSLWEGVLAALLAGLIILCTRKQPAALRYNLLTADLLLFLLVAGTTFFYELRQGDHPQEARGIVQGIGSSESTIVHVRQDVSLQFTRPDRTIQYIRRMGDYLNTQATVITLIWLACLSVQVLRLAGGFYQAGRLRRKGVVLPGEYWNERLSILVRQLGINRRVTLLQSRLVKGPVVFGFLKPFILVPLGLLSNLPSDQVETILLHELAHIRRGDTIANLLLHLTEAIFFFNPGVRWIATLMRREREACCDDIVLAGASDRQHYFEALVAFTQFAIDGRVAGGRSYALELGGGKTDLVWRVRRMLEQENKKLQIMEKAILSFGLMAMVSFSLISKSVPPVADANNGARPRTMSLDTLLRDTLQPRAMQLKADTLPQQQEAHAHGFGGRKLAFKSLSSHSDQDDGQKKYYALAIDEKENRYEIRKLNDRILEFRVNGKLIAKEEYDKYTDVFESIEAERKVHPRPIPPVPPVAPHRPLSAVGMTEHTDTLRRAGTREHGESVEPIQPIAPVEPRESRVVPVQKEEAPTMANPLVFTNHPDPYLKGIAADLVENKLIDHVDRLSFTLNSDELIVNGTRQPVDIHVRFKEKYIKKATDRFIYSQYYTSHGSGSHAEVHTGDNDASSTPKSKSI